MDIEQRLADLEKFVKEQKDFKKQSQEMLAELRTLRVSKTELTDQNEKLTSQLKAWRELEDWINRNFHPSEMPQETSLKNIQLAHKGLEIRVNHDPVNDVVRMSTTNTEGKIIFCAVKDLQKESLSEAGWTASQLRDKMLEHGWALKDSTFSAKLSILAGEGKLIKTPSGYRLPEFVPFEVQEAQQ